LWLSGFGTWLHVVSQLAFGTQPAPSLQLSHFPVSVLHLAKVIGEHSSLHAFSVWVHFSGSLDGSQVSHVKVSGLHLANGFPQVAAQ
jgi:hypothetical protein